MDEKIKNEIYNNFYLSYLVSVIEAMHDKGKITEEMYINARNNAYKGK